MIGGADVVTDVLVGGIGVVTSVGLAGEAGVASVDVALSPQATNATVQSAPRIHATSRCYWSALGPSPARNPIAAGQVRRDLDIVVSGVAQQLDHGLSLCRADLRHQPSA